MATRPHASAGLLQYQPVVLAFALRGCSFGPVKRAVKKSFAKVLRRRMFERADGSGTRVTTAPWRTNFLAGFRAIPGLVSLGTFFASKESTSATPKALKKPAAKAKSLKNRPSKPACEKAPTAGNHARRAGENHFKTNAKPASQQRKYLGNAESF